jgi:hypothetical protein
LNSENCSRPLSQKPVQKRFLPQKGVAFLRRGSLQKKFHVRERIPLRRLRSPAVRRLSPNGERYWEKIT